ncbi:hypothetical protein [Mongoliimonas terrestris]|uniref:hypothetical protein n=1 Tax=Mongoliimonas terrestris TaxID=1709001 RepID=UPI000ACDBCE0|nr:hypothetical protein [Mongoliimonas terrestris]
MRREPAPDMPPTARRSDLVLSVMLPLSVILVGVALSVDPSATLAAVIDLCRSVLP